MPQNTNVFILHKMKYKENSIICRCYSQTYGIFSGIIKNAFSKKSKSKGIHFLPLAHLELVFYESKNPSSLKLIKESSLLTFYKSLHLQSEKIAIVFFLAEFLNKTLKEEFQNEKLFDFISASLKILDEKEKNFANFHLIFMLRLSRYLGFYPNIESRDLEFFCLKDGVFKETYENFCLEKKESLLFKQLLKLDFKDNFNDFSPNQSQSLTYILLRYFSFHQQGFGEIKSLEILKSLYF